MHSFVSNVSKTSFLASVLALSFVHSSYAHEDVGRADSHGPIGVMGDHTHEAGEFMVSYRHMEMSMSGNQVGSSDIADDTLVTTVPNRFAGMSGMPPTLRIAPQDMTMKMDMFGFMYAPSDRVTLMAMLNYVSKDMRLHTYQGGMGTTVLGAFDTSSSGLGDTKLAALVSLMNKVNHKLHLNLGLSLPTGDIEQRGDILTPMPDMPKANMRLPYAMQLGSGTYDVEPGITYTGMSDQLSWGAQYKALVRTGTNSADYTLGDKHTVTAWGQYLFDPAVSASLRVEARNVGEIDGMDANIMGPVQTADPSNYGGDYVDVGLGVNYYGQSGILKKHRFAAEYSLPFMQDVNGIQMQMDAMFTVGYQYAF